MGILHKYVTKKISKYESANSLNELEKGEYNFDKEDIADDGNDNFLHLAFNDFKQNKQLIDAFIKGSIINPNYYGNILVHRGKNKLTPISSLIINNKLYAKTLLRKLINNKALFQTLSICRKDDKNILHYLIEHGYSSIINEYLIELFDKAHDDVRINIINHKDENGNTPLHIAARKGNHIVAKILIRLGADCKVLNKSQQTPVKIATDSKHAIAANIIYQYGHSDDDKQPILPKNITFTNKIFKNKNKKLKNIVFCGGGVKGIAYLGVVQALETKPELLDGVENVAGTSAGAITAFLLALGYKSTEIESFLFENGSSIKRFIAFNKFKLLRFQGFSGGVIFLDTIKAILTKRLLEVYNLSKNLNDITIKNEFENFFTNIFTKDDLLHLDKLDTSSKVFKIEDYDKFSNDIKNINFIKFHELVQLCKKAKKYDMNFHI